MLSVVCANIDYTTGWVKETVLAQEDSKKRASSIKHFITIAEVRSCKRGNQKCSKLCIEMPKTAKLLDAYDDCRWS